MNNREVKFRAWDKLEKRMWQVNAIDFKNGEFLEVEDAESKSVITCPKGQISERFELLEFTGLKDKNGKEIFEGDILYRFTSLTPKGQSPNQYMQVEWDSVMAGWRFWNEAVVVGNIYANPELVK